MSAEEWPSVTVVIPTRDRPSQLRDAIRAVAEQDYPGKAEVRVIFDQAPVDTTLADLDFVLPVYVSSNSRTPGLCGSRNTGILASNTELVAFCDDDDAWLPGKLRAQVAALRAAPESVFASTGAVFSYGDRRTPRYAGKTLITQGDLVRSRMAMLHSSSFMARRQALVEQVGLFEERLPGSMCEDWDILLRASAVAPIAHVDQPLVQVLWAETSFFARRWETKLDAHLWMWEHHPEVHGNAVGSGRLLGQIAFDQAALGRRWPAMVYAARAMRRNPREHRAVFALLVASRLVTAGRLLSMLHRHGRGV